LTFEDHGLCGGIYEAVCGAVAEHGSIKVFGKGVDGIPTSGTP